MPFELYANVRNNDIGDAMNRVYLLDPNIQF